MPQNDILSKVSTVRYDNIRAFEKHLEGASPHHLSPLYLIIGKDDFECKEALQLLKRFLISSDQKDMAFKSWEGAQADPQELLTDLYSQSFFTEKRVIFIHQMEKLKKSVWKELEKYVKKIPRSQYLILSANTLCRQTNLYKLVEKEGIILEFAELKPWEKEKFLIDWVAKQVAAQRKLMSYQVCQQFIRQVGIEQATVANELEKLFCFIGSRQEITRQDVEQINSAIVSSSIWQLGEAIFGGDVSLALKTTKSLLQDGSSLLPLLRQIRSQFVTAYQLCLLLVQGKQPTEIISEFPHMKGQILDKNIANARQYGMETLRRGLLEIDHAEARVKNSEMDEHLLADTLIIKLTRKIF